MLDNFLMSFLSLKTTAISAADLFTVTDGSLLQLLVLPGNMIEFEKVLNYTYLRYILGYFRIIIRQ